jgi:hypothetical protein
MTYRTGDQWIGRIARSTPLSYDGLTDRGGTVVITSDLWPNMPLPGSRVTITVDELPPRWQTDTDSSGDLYLLYEGTRVAQLYLPLKDDAAEVQKVLDVLNAKDPRD